MEFYVYRHMYIFIYTSIYTCAYIDMYVRTHFYLYVCVYINFTWQPKHHWKRERLKAGRLVRLVAQVTEDEP